MADTLHLYTLKFPFGKGENFLETEIPYLAKTFQKVIIYPWTFGGDEIRHLPDNVLVKEITSRLSSSAFSRMKLVLPNIFRASYLTDLRYQWSHAGNLVSRAAALKVELGEDLGLHYSYWLSDWATVLGLLTQEKEGLKYISRAHGFDVYDERHPLGYQPYREVQLEKIHKLFPVSARAEYAIAKQADFGPMQVAHLGTEDQGLGPIPEEGEVLRVISCSTVSSLKRVTMIPELLGKLDIPIYWTHIGDGPEMDVLKEKAAALDKKIEVHLTGNLSPDEVMGIYKKQPFHVFLHLSSSEGIPVSMMEAISFGIPVIAVNVGAVREIVNTQTGAILHKDDSVADWADQIKTLLSLGNGLPEKDQVRSFWEQEFKADKNYRAFCENLTH